MNASWNAGGCHFIVEILKNAIGVTQVSTDWYFDNNLQETNYKTDGSLVSKS